MTESIKLVNGPIYRVGMALGWWFHIKADNIDEAHEHLSAWCVCNGVQRREMRLSAASGFHYESDEPVVVIMRGKEGR